MTTRTRCVDDLRVVAPNAIRVMSSTTVIALLAFLTVISQAQVAPPVSEIKVTVVDVMGAAINKSLQ